MRCVVKPAILLRKRFEGIVATSSVIFLFTLGWGTKVVATNHYGTSVEVLVSF